MLHGYIDAEVHAQNRRARPLAAGNQPREGCERETGQWDRFLASLILFERMVGTLKKPVKHIEHPSSTDQND
jgi:hypothetical protein